ncbi:hypothetical protein OIY81_746 [Cryptosporidium canis]|uniref:Uncharacterized protein n=1 Tax=Cryptosporidium canis TaxID=195482 RepID=A0ABQ8PBK3_9CRYT|nr:hypothetical protein OIY81_746 [Cryptosporidium canis]KAJ1615274.1 hypothetical protein OJ252_289 [Cryptosporidium canis]
MDSGCAFNLLLFNIEFVLEENNLLEYAFGVNHPEISTVVDNSLIRVIVYNKMLHCLNTIKHQISCHNKYLDEHNERIQLLKLKLEKKLDQELMEKGISFQNDKLELDTNKNDSFENKPVNNVNNYLEEFSSFSKNEMEENIDHGMNERVINNHIKDELVELAYEMKSSALKFQELFRNEKKNMSKQQKHMKLSSQSKI